MAKSRFLLQIESTHFNRIRPSPSSTDNPPITLISSPDTLVNALVSSDVAVIESNDGINTDGRLAHLRDMHIPHILELVL